ncbi:MAG: non-canonical purine NTP diphosphatase [Bacteroidota bacterium]|uniref:dITP/XTP pyrophosphatase n=1 Tax=Flagellimonas profundi TaxID=2915620 RepID=A0ABS3FDQ0_9FLAO|nr:non-canonical purine NTP diphosphatase [Allomuricauda profundi]MBO0341282.1 non-canonical purine NTP diphosphatase [Allomuricauda profundi]MEC7771167.1 non-canonical purine NTP diphosphatase [Bacteroidota bacterium]
MKLVFATHNDHKLKEVQQLLPENIELLSLKDIECFDEIPETGDTLEENAKIKADYVTRTYGLDCFSDDTGLLVDALDGAPGVYSARYAGGQKNASDNMAKLLSELEGTDVRSAHFKTVVHLNLQGVSFTFDGIVEGRITTEQHGEGGFGYDPIFKPDGYDQTFGELSSKTKNAISHRGRAIQKLVAFLKKNAT